MKSIYICASNSSAFVYNLLERLNKELGSYRIRGSWDSPIEYQNDLQVDIKNEINRSDFILGIITDENPFVFFELGLAIGLRKKILLLRAPDIILPIDLRRVDSFVFYPDSNSWLFETLKYLELNTLEPGEQHINFNSAYEEICSYKYNSQYFDSLDPKYFEELVFRCFREKGFKAEKSDGIIHMGYDFVVYDFAGFDKVIVEIKKYNFTSKVSIGKVQQLIGAMYSSQIDNAIMISNADFTKSAIDFAERTNSVTDMRLLLWSLEEFTATMNK